MPNYSIPVIASSLVLPDLAFPPLHPHPLPVSCAPPTEGELLLSLLPDIPAPVVIPDNEVPDEMVSPTIAKL